MKPNNSPSPEHTVEDEKVRAVVIDWFERHSKDPAPNSYSIQLIINTIRHYSTEYQNYKRGYSRGFDDCKTKLRSGITKVLEATHE